MRVLLVNAIGGSLATLVLVLPAYGQLQATKLSAAAHHSCAITTDGNLKCWGLNYRGELGDGTLTKRIAPVSAQLAAGVRDVSIDHSLSCAVTAEGGVKCWGRSLMVNPNDFLSPFPLSTLPMDVHGLESGVSQISVGSRHACALTLQGGVTCWGANDLGQLGDGTTRDAAAPTGQFVPGLQRGVTSISAFNSYTCALTSGGGVKCWGTSNTVYRSGVVDVSGLTSGVVALSSGKGNHICAVLATGDVRCWGFNNFGQLGDGTQVERTVPVAVKGLQGRAGAVATADNHTCAAIEAGGVQCWGSNSAGQLGDGTRETRLAPVKVAGISGRVTALAVGTFHSCAMVEGDGARCWGSNSDGQLGDGTGVDRSVPTSVLDHAITPSYQGLWWKSPAGSESGWGVNIAHQGDTLFAAWFTYDADGSGLWLVMSNGVKTGNDAYEGKLYRVTGDAFSATPWDSSKTRLTEVGSAFLSFNDVNDGVFFYTVNGVTDSKSITRNAFATPMPRCEIGGTRQQPWNFQDLWWRSPAGSEAGWGLSIAHAGDTIFATWFSYDATGKGIWLVLPNGAKTGPNTYAGALYRTFGPAFTSAPWSSQQVRVVPAGTASLSFSDADNGTFAYTLDGVSQVKPITRQVYSSPQTVCN